MTTASEPPGPVRQFVALTGCLTGAVLLGGGFLWYALLSDVCDGFRYDTINVEGHGLVSVFEWREFLFALASSLGISALGAIIVWLSTKLLPPQDDPATSATTIDTGE